MHVKCINGWSNKSFDTLLEILKDAFSSCEKLPMCNYDAKKIVKDNGLYYEKFDASMNDCIMHLNVQLVGFRDGRQKVRW